MNYSPLTRRKTASSTSNDRADLVANRAVDTLRWLQVGDLRKHFSPRQSFLTKSCNRETKAKVGYNLVFFVNKQNKNSLFKKRVVSILKRLARYKS